MTYGNEFRGIPLKTLEVSDPNIRGKKTVVRAIPFAYLLVIATMTYLAVFTFKNDPSLQWDYLFLAVIMTFLYFAVFIFMHSILGNSGQKIVFYDNGVGFPAFLWNRIRGRKGFVHKDQIISIRGTFLTQQNAVSGAVSELRFHTKNGKSYTTGPRINTDIQMISEWIESTWKLNVERVGGPSRLVPAPSKVPVVTGGQARTCIGCGYSFPNQIGFCPSCGRMASNEAGPIDRPVAEMVPEQPPVLAEPLPAPYQYQQPQPQSQCPPVQRNQYGQEPPSVPQSQCPPVQRNQYRQELPPVQSQYAPVYQSQYATPQYPAVPIPNPAYGQYMYQQIDPYAKNPRVATILAAAMGLLGMMGIGHLYMKKYVKGMVLLMVGGFLAIMSLVSIMMLFTPDQFSFGVHFMATVLMSAPFLLLYLWQVFDAPKPKKCKAAKNDYGYYQPPKGPER